MWSPTKMFVMQKKKKKKVYWLLLLSPWTPCWLGIVSAGLSWTWVRRGPRCAPRCRTLDPAFAVLCSFPRLILLSESSERTSTLFTTVMLKPLSQYFAPQSFESQMYDLLTSHLVTSDINNTRLSIKLCLNVVMRTGFSLWYCKLYHSSILLWTCSQLLFYFCLSIASPQTTHIWRTVTMTVDRSLDLWTCSFPAPVYTRTRLHAFLCQASTLFTFSLMRLYSCVPCFRWRFHLWGPVVSVDIG